VLQVTAGDARVVAAYPGLNSGLASIAGQQPPHFYGLQGIPREAIVKHRSPCRETSLFFSPRRPRAR
jgi:hypothetical protein